MSFEIGERVVLIVDEVVVDTEEGEKRASRVEVGWVHGDRGPLELVDFGADGGRLCVEVRDDGAGGATLTPGGGLAGLRDRVQALDGTLEVVSPVGGPTSLRVAMPVAMAATVQMTGPGGASVTGSGPEQDTRPAAD